MRALLLGQPDQSVLHRLKVGEDQLGVERADVGHWVDRAVDVHHVGIAEDPHDFTDSVTFADGGQELVAEPLTLRGAADDASDIDERDHGWNDAFAIEEGRQALEAWVRHRDRSDVGLNRGKGIVGGEHLVVGQGVEEGRLADVGQAHDPDVDRHSLSLGCFHAPWRQRRGPAGALTRGPRVVDALGGHSRRQGAG